MPFQFRVLAGLPGEGEPPLQFSATGRGKHREGFVVEFSPEHGEPWVGNFQPGLTDTNCVVVENDGAHALVVSGGQGYRVCVASKSCEGTVGGQITIVIPVPAAGGWVLGNGLWFELQCGGEILWRTRRLSWDGVRNIEVSGALLSGEAWMFDDSWHSFTVNLKDGEAQGGAYTEPGV